ncbi:hypothetical protein AAFF_G00430190 [Aldrovandia affinis]|uniref:Uncharacterized protein n=1 Tax=Aldrovandia affinis TaxID=143900 RepID=A0AAD7WIR9_9TELE|nr:hypothetical protein AAFF_G00430190 [Aldrovandia affinis]
MARGAGAEQYSATSLLQNKPTSKDGIKLSVKRIQRTRLSVCSKLCYAIGGAPYQITGSALGFFLQIYLLDVAQLEPFYASIILFVGRAWDAVTDPTVGFLVSRTPWTRWGRMMPWIILSTPLAVMCYILIWYVPSFEQGKMAWYMLFYCLFQSLQTCFHVPYSSLTMFISSDQRERDSATAYRMTVEVMGTVIGTAIQGQIVGGANALCGPGDLGTEEGFNSTAQKLGPEVNITPVSLEETKQAYLMASGVICAVYVLCAFILVLGVREKKDSGRLKTGQPMSFFQGFRLVMGHGPYAKLVMGFLFTSLAFMLLDTDVYIQEVADLFVPTVLCWTYTLGLRNDFQNILLVIMLSATLTIPFWQWFLTRFGKKTAVYVGILWAVPFMILLACMESNLMVAYVASIGSGASVAVAFLLPWSMLPDVVDDFKLKNPGSCGHEAIFYSFYVFFTKFASGVSLGISTLSLE